MKQKVCLITGGAKRIGKEICIHLAKDGWNVAIHYNKSIIDAKKVEQEIKKYGIKSMSIQSTFPQKNDKGYEQVIGEVENHLGSINLLVNNAARFEYDTPTNISTKNLQMHFDENFIAPVMLTKCLFNTCKKRKKNHLTGTVINILDQKLWNPNPDFFSYTISKAALNEATHLMAREMAPIMRVVSISPGITLKSSHQDKENFKSSHAKTVLGKSSSPSDIAAAVVWLSKNESITGINLTVDGGQHLLCSSRDVMFTNS